jgi:hypothetical protein
MTTHSSILPWKILWTEKPGRLQSIGLQRVHRVAKTQTQLSSLAHTQAKANVSEERHFSHHLGLTIRKLSP